MLQTPISTRVSSSASSDVYKGQVLVAMEDYFRPVETTFVMKNYEYLPVPYTHLRAHETVLDHVCCMLLVKLYLKNNICVLVPLYGFQVDGVALSMSDVMVRVSASSSYP